MAQKYKKKEPTGREYVDATKEFCSLIIFHCTRLPERWYDVFLKPLIEQAQKIEELVVCANRVYINPEKMDSEMLVQAYKERDQMLYEVIRMFAAYDISFNRLMSQIDIAGAEKRRLKNILLHIIREEQEKNPDISKIEIKVVSRISDMEFTSTFGNKCMKLKLTRKSRDQWIKREQEPLEYIRKRIADDNKAVSRLNA